VVALKTAQSLTIVRAKEYVIATELALVIPTGQVISTAVALNRMVFAKEDRLIALLGNVIVQLHTLEIYASLLHATVMLDVKMVVFAM